MNEAPIEEVLGRIAGRTAELLDRGKFVLALGGEHTITVGLLAPYLERYKGGLTVVRSTPMPTSGTSTTERPTAMRAPCAGWPRRFRSSPPESVPWKRPKFETARRLGVKHFPAHEMPKNPNWIRDLVTSIATPNVYLTFDLDGLDPSVMPSVGDARSGWPALERGSGVDSVDRPKHRIVGADVNELCPGPLRSGEFAAALLCHKIIAYAFEADLRGTRPR